MQCNLNTLLLSHSTWKRKKCKKNKTNTDPNPTTNPNPKPTIDKAPKRKELNKVP